MMAGKNGFVLSEICHVTMKSGDQGIDLSRDVAHGFGA